MEHGTELTKTEAKEFEAAIAAMEDFDEREEELKDNENNSQRQ